MRRHTICSPDDRLPLLQVELGEGSERWSLDRADGDDGDFRSSGLGLFEDDPVIPLADDFDDPLVAEVPVAPLGNAWSGSGLYLDEGGGLCLTMLSSTVGESGGDIGGERDTCVLQ